MKILVIEDDIKVQAYIAKGLHESGHVVDKCSDGKEGLFLATTENYDVLIVDRMLPQLDGLTIIKTLRGADNRTPALILSALDQVDHRVEGLRAGGDDYLTKPFAFAELLARIDALNRRHNGNPEKQETALTAHGITLNLLSRKVTRDGEVVPLQTREYNLLEYLMRHQGQIVTRTMLLESVWDYHFDPQTNVIDVHISRLRKKISDTDGTIIQTIRGAGYMIA